MALEPQTTIPDKAAFLREYTITEEQFEKSQLDWSVLCDIRNHYKLRRAEFQTVANSISQTLQQVPSVHSLKVRVKDPDHLIEKIIRKQLEHIAGPELRPTYTDCTPETYDSRITDLVGIRALHLFKEQWFDIHDFIEETWDRQEPPVAYVREGDDTRLFKATGCNVKPHKSRYTSVHYLIKSNPTKRIHLVELQVRTIFEEAWAEIDHSVRYPRQSEDELLVALLLTFSLVVGFADELGSFTRRLSEHLRTQSAEITAAREEVQKKLSEISMGQEERAQLQEKIEQLERASAVPKTRSLPAPRPGADDTVSPWFTRVFGPLTRTLDALNAPDSIAGSLAGLNSPIYGSEATRILAGLNSPMYGSDATARIFAGLNSPMYGSDATARIFAGLNSPIDFSDATARVLAGLNSPMDFSDATARVLAEPNSPMDFSDATARVLAEPNSPRPDSRRSPAINDVSATKAIASDAVAATPVKAPPPYAQEPLPQEETESTRNELKCTGCGETLPAQTDEARPSLCRGCAESAKH